MATIQLASIKKKYGALEVLHGIDAFIEDGEFAVLVGPSGCGKSTLLRMLAGLESITGGEISIGDTVVNDLLPKERNIAMVFQNYALYPHMTVAENMGFSLKLRKIPTVEINEKVMHSAEILGLENLLERYPRQLSGGQRQRVAMGRAIVRNPDVFLFDEPLSNLDAKLRVQMRTEIKALHQKLKSTIVYVTHDQIEAMTMADKIIVLDNGDISQIGSPLELYDNPINKFVATFIGSPAMNILAATVTSPTKIQLEDGQTIDLMTAQPMGRKILLGIRPEHMAICVDDTGVKVSVDVIEPTGAETHVTCAGPNCTVLVAIRDRTRLSIGEELILRVDPERCHIFCAETEQTLPSPQRPPTVGSIQ